MTARTFKAITTAAGLAALAVFVATPAFSHHSFAMYDQNKVVTITGVVKQYVPQANHAEFHVYVLADDRKGLLKGKDGKSNVEWGVEMAGTAQLERQGITAQTYPVGTVISFKVNPSRDGSNFGARVGALAKCPTNPATKRPKLPEAGKHCDSVEGVTLTGGNTF
jgi:hypothetical protein